MLKSLGTSVRMVIIALNAPSWEFFPDNVRSMVPEPSTTPQPPKQAPTTPILDEKGGCSLEHFVQQLVSARYQLVTVHHHAERNCCRFGFAAEEYAHQFNMDAKPALRAEMFAALTKLVGKRKWNGVRIYAKKAFDFTQGNVEVPGQSVLDIGAVFPKAMSENARVKHLCVVDNAIDIAEPV